MGRQVESVRWRIARDQGGARFVALMASAPAWAIAAASVCLAGLLAFSPSNDSS